VTSCNGKWTAELTILYFLLIDCETLTFELLATACHICFYDNNLSHADVVSKHAWFRYADSTTCSHQASKIICQSHAITDITHHTENLYIWLTQAKFLLVTGSMHAVSLRPPSDCRWPSIRAPHTGWGGVMLIYSRLTSVSPQPGGRLMICALAT